MTEKIFLQIASEAKISFLVVKSWYQQGYFSDKKSWITFFRANPHIREAQPFLKWVGGKRQILSQLQAYFPKTFNNYFEPFVWWWAVFFNIHKERSFLSDINEDLINTYIQVKNNPVELIQALKKFRYDKDFFLTVRNIDREEKWREKYSPLARAARFIYLNRTCFNGLYRVNSRWEFNVPFGAYTNPDFVQLKNIIRASRVLNDTKADLKVQSFEKVLEEAKVGDFVYLDPPYDTLSETSNFTSYVKEDCGKELQYTLAEVCKKLHKKWVFFMLSNHNTPLIQELYKDYTIYIVQARRNVNSKANGRGKVEEVVVINY
jgi:DNA adenine methylase